MPGTTLDTVIEETLAVAKDGTRDAIVAIVEAARSLKGADHATVVAEFHRIIARYSPMGDNVQHTPQKAGIATDAYQPSRLHAIEELPLALGFAVVNDGDFYKTIVDGINSGRDTDSIGVMAGAILGAMYGESIIDRAMASQLDRVNRLDLFRSADAFTATVTAIQAADRTRETARAQARAGLFPAPELTKVSSL